MVAAKAKGKARARLDAGNLDVLESSRAPGALGRGGIAPDHPLAVAFESSYDEGVEYSVTVNNTDLAVKLLQKLANSTGRSLRKSVSGKEITFLVADKKPRKPSVETAVDPEL